MGIQRHTSVSGDRGRPRGRVAECPGDVPRERETCHNVGVLLPALPSVRLSEGLMRELEDGTSGAANFVLADAEDDRWLPEVRRLLPFP